MNPASTKKGRRISKEIRRENGPKLDRLERIRDHFASHSELSDDDQRYLADMNGAIDLLREGLSQGMVAKELQKGAAGRSRSVAYRIVRDAIELYGDVTKPSKEGLRHVLTERYSRLAQKGIENGDLNFAKSCYDAIAKINRVDQADTEKRKRTRRVQISYTTDPSVLRNTTAEEIEEYERRS